MNNLIKGKPISELPPTAVADMFYRDGESVDCNPYLTGSSESVEFSLRFNKHLNNELERIREELRAGI